MSFENTKLSFQNAIIKFLKENNATKKSLRRDIEDQDFFPNKFSNQDDPKKFPFFIGDVVKQERISEGSKKQTEQYVKIALRVNFLLEKYNQLYGIQLTFCDITYNKDFFNICNQVFEQLFRHLKQLKFVEHFDGSFEDYSRSHMYGERDIDKFHQKYRFLQVSLATLLTQRYDYNSEKYPSLDDKEQKRGVFNSFVESEIALFSAISPTNKVPCSSSDIEAKLNIVSLMLQLSSKQPWAALSSGRDVPILDEEKQVEHEINIEQLQQELEEMRRLLQVLEQEKRELEEARTASAVANQAQEKELEAKRRGLEEREAELKRVKTSSAAANQAKQLELEEMRSRLVQLEKQLEDQQRQTELERLGTTASPRHNGRRGSWSPDSFSDEESDSDHTLPVSDAVKHNFMGRGTGGSFSDEIVDYSIEEDNGTRHIPVTSTQEFGSTTRFHDSYRRRYVDESKLFDPQTRLRRSGPSHQHDEIQPLAEELSRLEFEIKELRRQRELESKLGEQKRISAEQNLELRLMLALAEAKASHNEALQKLKEASDAEKRISEANLAEVKAEHEKALRRLEANSESKSAEALQKLKEASDAEKRSSAEDKRMLEQAQKELAARLAAVETSKSDSESKSAGEMRKLSEGHEKALRGLEEKFAKDLAEAKAAATPSTPTRSSSKPLTGSPTSVADIDLDKEGFLHSIPSEMLRLNKSSNNQAFDNFISLCKQDGADGDVSFQVIFNTIQVNKSAYINFANKLLTRLALMSDTEVKKAFHLIKQFSDKDQQHDMWCQLFDVLSERADYDTIIKQNRAAFIEFAKLSVAMKDTTDAVECFNAIDDQKIQNSISRQLGSHSDFFSLSDERQVRSDRQQLEYSSDNQVPIVDVSKPLDKTEGKLPVTKTATATSMCASAIALGSIASIGGGITAMVFIPAGLFCGAFVVSSYATKYYNSQKTKGDNVSSEHHFGSDKIITR